ncbi:MAG: SIMPL domain-containing protein [Amaricoccus sp.]
MRSSALAVLLALALAGTASAETERQITATGSAQVETVPDLATVTAGVETQGASAAEALGANSAAMTAVLKALDGAKVERKDVQTSQLTINPVYDNPDDGSPSKVTGYQASNMVTVRVRDVAALGGIVDAVTAAGANRLYGIGFDVADPKPALDEARRQAVADAQHKAELFAAAAGVKLGALLSLSEGGNGGGPVPVFARADMAKAAPVEAGTVSVSADVSLVFSIE